MQISALAPEILKFEKHVKYANERSDDVIHSTQYNIKYVNRAISVILQRRPLKLGRLIVLQMNEGVVSKETVVLRRWGSSIQKFGFINGVDNVNWPPYRDSKS